MALFRFGSNRKLQAPDSHAAPAAELGVASPQEATVDAPCRSDAAAGGPPCDAHATPAGTAPEDEESDVAVSELNLGDDDFSSMFGTQPSQFSDTTAGDLRDDPWSTRLRLD